MSRMKWMGSLLLVVTFAAFAALAGAQEENLTAKNKELVTSFFRTVFVDHKVDEGFAKYVGDTYVQHNPNVPDGKLAALTYLKMILGPTARAELKRVIAEGDLVTLHQHSRPNETDVGYAIVDIFRVADGKIVEHWDVIQRVSDMPMNTNTMF